MGSGEGVEHGTALMAELARALQLVRLLESHLANSAPTDFCKSLAPEILYSIQKSILMAQSSSFDGEGAPPSTTGHSPCCENPCPPSEGYDCRQMKKNRWESFSPNQGFQDTPYKLKLTSLASIFAGIHSINGQHKWSSSPAAPEESKDPLTTATAGESTGRRISSGPNTQGHLISAWKQFDFLQYSPLSTHLDFARSLQSLLQMHASKHTGLSCDEASAAIGWGPPAV